MRGSLVTLCVGIAVGLLASCESTKSPKNDRPAVDPAKVAAPITPSIKAEKPKADEAKPAISDVPTAPLAMEKLGDAEGGEADLGQAVSLEDAFPERLLPTSKLSDKMVKRIRYKLRDVTKAPIALRKFIQVPNPDGSLEVFAIYEFSEFEGCVRGYPTRKEGRAACLSQVSHAYCTRLGAVRAHFGQPKEGASMDTSGSLAVWSMAFEDTHCSADEETAFVDDVDRDGKLEMLIDLRTSYTEGGDRSPSEFGYKRQLHVFPGADGSEPFSLDVDAWSYANGSDRPSELASQLETGDFNHDGHMDFLLSHAADCDLEDYGDDRDAKVASCVKQARSEAVYLYELKGDKWEESDELSAARTEAAAKEAAEAAEEAKKEEAEAAAEEKAAAESAKPAAATPAAAPPAAPKSEAGAAKAK